MKTYLKFAAAAVFGAGMLALTAGSGSAAVVCNSYGSCWHVRHAYTYPAEAGIVVHPNGWRWGPKEHFVWREHPGRGYWRNGVWIKL
ncbi:MAG: hypothetical protein ACREHV_12895 [Rhizomicrobium sp.]